MEKTAKKLKRAGQEGRIALGTVAVVGLACLVVARSRPSLLLAEESPQALQTGGSSSSSQEVPPAAGSSPETPPLEAVQIPSMAPASSPAVEPQGAGAAQAFPAAAPAGKTIEVRVGESIQAAITSARPGDVIRIFPGEYHEFLYIDKPNITLTGVIEGGRWPRLEGKGKLNDGVIASGSGFSIENLYIANYKGNGVMTQGANDVVMRNLMIDHTGIYGIYPTLGTNIVIEDTVSWGIADAAIYVGMCNHVDVRRNEVFGNVSGIEIENSVDVLVEENNVYDNTAGILVFNLPGLPRKKSERVIVRRNFVYENNHRNFAARGAIVANVPPGTGVMILASDHGIVEENVIRRNSLAGILIADASVLPESDKPDPEADATSDNNAILRNLFYDNGRRNRRDRRTWLHFVRKTIFGGGSPPSAGEGSSELFPQGADILAIVGQGQENCLSHTETLTLIGAKKFGVCDPRATSAEIATKVGVSGASPEAAVMNEAETGKHIYGTVCSGCHAYSLLRIGPPVIELQQKYANNPLGIVKYASEPRSVRKGFPPMPSQKYLGTDKLSAAAKYILSIQAGTEQ